MLKCGLCTCTKLGKVNLEAKLVSGVTSHMPLDNPGTLLGAFHVHFVLACMQCLNIAVLFAS